MTELREVLNVNTGHVETAELYSHKEFTQRKRSRLKELRSEAENLRKTAVLDMSIDAAIAHRARCIALFSEWQSVRSAVGPMVVAKEKEQSK